MAENNPKETYIVAEIGQNHNGDIDLCKKLIDQLVVSSYDETTGKKLNTINAIKLNKRDLDEELAEELMNRPYDSKHSFGKTYGEHRRFVELSYEEHCEISDYVHNKGIDFIDTLGSPKTVNLLDMTTVDKAKIASRDLVNIPLLKAISKKNVDIVISTGLSDEEELINALKVLDTGKNKIWILHCLTQYPAQHDRLNLNSIKVLTEKFGDRYTIGYSDHSTGIHIPLAAVAMGAKMIEKHVTLDKTMKGTDQACSADPQEMKQLVHNIRTFDLAKGTFSIHKDDITIEASKKLGRSLASKRDLHIGETIEEQDIHLLCPGSGLKWKELDEIVGKQVIRSIPKNTLIDLKCLK